jgi:cholesterol transport system auxiliary component
MCIAVFTLTRVSSRGRIVVRVVRPARLISVAAIALALGGCAVLRPPAPTPQTYDLIAPTAETGRLGATRSQILIARPTSVAVLNSSRVVIRTEDGELTYLKATQWADDLPLLFQARMVEAFENTGSVRAVGRPGEGLLIDHQVVIDIRAFEIDTGAGVARVIISAKLMNDRNGRVISSQRFGAEAVIDVSDQASFVGALNDAARAVMVDTVRWALAKI